MVSYTNTKTKRRKRKIAGNRIARVMESRGDNDAESTASELTPSAASKTFNTFELLEAILLLLPAKDIFLAQRVHSSWQDTVSNSSRLQQILFLTPLEPGSFQPGVGVERTWHHPKHLDAESEAFILHNHIAQQDLGPILNPLIQLIFPCKHSQDSDVFRLPSHARYEDLLNDAAKSTYLSKMSLVQPPTRVIAIERFSDVEKRHRTWHPRPRYFSYISSRNGAVTVAELILHLLDLRRNWEPCEYFVIRGCKYRGVCELDPYVFATSRPHSLYKGVYHGWFVLPVPEMEVEC